MIRFKKVLKAEEMSEIELTSSELQPAGRTIQRSQESSRQWRCSEDSACEICVIPKRKMRLAKDRQQPRRCNPDSAFKLCGNPREITTVL